MAEAVALSTCNRTEVYVLSPDPARAAEAVAGALVAHTAIAPGELARARYLLRDERAAAHLFRVATSLDSMVVGESEIQGQVRSAWAVAAQEGASGPILDRLFRQALEVGKRVRSATAIGAGAASVSAVAVDLAAEVFETSPKARARRRGRAGRRGHGARSRAPRRPHRDGGEPHRGPRARAGRARRGPRRRVRAARRGARGRGHRHLVRPTRPP